MMDRVWILGTDMYIQSLRPSLFTASSVLGYRLPYKHCIRVNDSALCDYCYIEDSILGWDAVSMDNQILAFQGSVGPRLHCLHMSGSNYPWMQHISQKMESSVTALQKH
jgi:hypothetical protein